MSYEERRNRAIRLAWLLSLVALLAAAATWPVTATRAATIESTTYSRAVTKICAHALLFEQAHSTGTRAGALAVAADIRASTQRRIAHVVAIPARPELRATIGRWIVVEKRLADLYALDYVRIYDVIAAPRTSAQDAAAARRLASLVHGPDGLRRTAGRLELELGVPDCTGG
jgi:hypothetical protein